MPTTPSPSPTAGGEPSVAPGDTLTLSGAIRGSLVRKIRTPATVVGSF